MDLGNTDTYNHYHFIFSSDRYSGKLWHVFCANCAGCSRSVGFLLACASDKAGMLSFASFGYACVRKIYVRVMIHVIVGLQVYRSIRENATAKH